MAAATVAAATMTSRKHLLLKPFPLAVMSIATLLVLFALLMARIDAGSRSLAGGAAAVAQTERVPAHSHD